LARSNSGIAYIVVLAETTNTAERLLVDRAARVVDAQVGAIITQYTWRDTSP